MAINNNGVFLGRYLAAIEKADAAKAEAAIWKEAECKRHRNKSKKKNKVSKEEDKEKRGKKDKFKNKGMHTKKSFFSSLMHVDSLSSTDEEKFIKKVNERQKKDKIWAVGEEKENDDWIMIFSDEFNKYYYYNKETKTSQWNSPSDKKIFKLHDTKGVISTKTKKPRAPLSHSKETTSLNCSIFNESFFMITVSDHNMMSQEQGSSGKEKVVSLDSSRTIARRRAMGDTGMDSFFIPKSSFIIFSSAYNIGLGLDSLIRDYSHSEDCSPRKDYSPTSPQKTIKTTQQVKQVNTKRNKTERKVDQDFHNSKSNSRRKKKNTAANCQCTIS